ncbi:ribonuclease P protein component 1 [Methanopyrus sp. KOL6]|uniref:ribonuclease P protein component 1 n=1 Tax=Methanopyrus sp. KOL6 TaxID=1937004 RepID=UPI000B4B675D|nr:ribonuclease P protein component 1 [Methanopyrus sp. KOL6]
MPITPRNIVRHELIGLKCRVVKSLGPPYEGLEGKIVDETKNTLVLKTESGEKVIVKDRVLLEFKLPSGERVRVDGALLVGRPEERLSKRIKYAEIVRGRFDPEDYLD